MSKTDNFLNKIANEGKNSNGSESDTKSSNDIPFINQTNHDYLNEQTRPVRASSSQYKLITKIVSDSLFNDDSDKRLSKKQVVEECLHYGLPVFMKKHNLKLNTFIKEHNLKY